MRFDLVQCCDCKKMFMIDSQNDANVSCPYCRRFKLDIVDDAKAWRMIKGKIKRMR